MSDVSEVLDLSLLPKPDAIETLSFETLVDERLKDFAARSSQVGVPYTVTGLETDPIVIDQQVHAFREMLMRARVNNGIRSVLPAFARGADLENVVARANVVRIVRYGDNDEIIFQESDTALLRRYLASFAAPAAGSEDGYTFAALKAYPEAHDIKVRNGGAGKVLVHLLADGGMQTPLDSVFAVAKALDAKDVRPLTDDVTVSAAVINPYSMAGKLVVPRGPDPSQVVAAAVASVRAFGASRYRIGAEIPISALQAAAYVPNVLRVVMESPVEDMPAVANVAPYLVNVSLTYEVQA
ncbi:baseplate assembly protein [Agrobacterium tumefaciens]|uniref:baseplate assembly protein n=1 Tax=Agrobacterium tumefaciens TaxID=358 RepID=UPI0015734817|nr:baseplate J/gp47 family protein [Agrobacterium tumefaciens]NTD85494.1 hypothetical protein [Agrobacterium tumefaciens]NTD90843.1 hypothetical protein [Agrobacterium tumefaciens]NTE03665.1 hypothetical protein [Agrobacterium tumefaciens]NTE15917.1 hypothetical protein [Agrobacterium tumefaciens]NTE26491.1 hypothetical protein [Agrobacterium tumefaciens]